MGEGDSGGYVCYETRGHDEPRLVCTLESAVENVADVNGDVEVNARHHGRGVDGLGAEVG